jgi:hypothetical protein
MAKMWWRAMRILGMPWSFWWRSGSSIKVYESTSTSWITSSPRGINVRYCTQVANNLASYLFIQIFLFYIYNYNFRVSRAREREFMNSLILDTWYLILISDIWYLYLISDIWSYDIDILILILIFKRNKKQCLRPKIRFMVAFGCLVEIFSDSITYQRSKEGIWSLFTRSIYDHFDNR